MTVLLALTRKPVQAATTRLGCNGGRLLRWNSSASNLTPSNVKTAGGKARMVFDPLAGADTQATMEERAKKVFGTPGSREAQRLAAERSAVTIAGVKVPPKPLDPENCCGSGCINCVWELFRDELKEWQAARKEAYRALLKDGKEWPADMGPPPVLKRAKRVFAASPFDKLSKTPHPKKEDIIAAYADADTEVVVVVEEEEEDSWKDVDPSIRAFVENEKRIRARKLQQQKDKETKEAQAVSP